MKRLLLAGLFALVCATGAFAESIPLTQGTYFDGNDCAGTFGAPFASCVTPEEYGSSPIIAKWEPGDVWTLNTDVFPNLSTSMFSVSLTDDRTGILTYDGTGPLVRYVVLKAGNGFFLYPTGQTTVGPMSFAFGGEDATFTNGISHISLYDTTPVPEPGSTGVMLAMGLVGVWKARKR